MLNMKKYSRICARIDLDAVSHNLEVMKNRLSGDAKICAVIKADGYGHGALPIAKHIEENDLIWGFACATCEEAMELRNGGIRKPVILLGFAFPESYDDMIEHDIRACIFDYESAKLLSQRSSALQKKARIHIAVDTGMGRIGYRYDSPDAAEEIKRILELPGIEAEGLFTHFARADEKSLAPAEIQLERFLDFNSKLRAEGIEIPIVHASNSAGIMRFPKSHLVMARAGITLYGLYPSDEVADEMRDLRPVMSLVSHISYVKHVPSGTPVSYGGIYVTDRETTIATIPVGYADGYPRMLTGRGNVLIHGKKVPVIGRICMDQFMADVTDIPDVRSGDEVVLLGTQGDMTISAETIGAESGRFNYELVSDITKRVPRSYIAGGETIEQVDYFH